jgi:glutamyl endopeptidase
MLIKIQFMYTQYQLLPEFEIQGKESAFNNELFQRETVGIIGKDTRLLIRATTASPFKYICQIRIGMRLERPQSIATGFLIGPRTVMTAGHVVFGQEVGKLYILHGRNGLSKNPNPFGVYAATDYVMSNMAYGTTGNSPSNDYAIIHLHEEVPPELGYWGLSPNTTDKIGSSFLTTKYLPESIGTQKINLCGYPADKGSEHQYLSYNKTIRFNKEKSELFFMNDVTHGNSGSPIWIRRSTDKGGRVLIGITTAVQQNKAGTKTDYNVGVFLTGKIRDFMKKNTL